MFYKAHRNTASNGNTDILIHLKKSVLKFCSVFGIEKTPQIWHGPAVCNVMLVNNTLPKQAAARCHLMEHCSRAERLCHIFCHSQGHYRIQSFFFHLKGLTSNSLQPQLQLYLKGTLPEQCKMGCILLYTQSKKMDHWLTKGTNR